LPPAFATATRSSSRGPGFGRDLRIAKGVSRLVSRRVGLWPLVAFAAAGLGAVVVATVASPGLRHLIELVVVRLRDLLGLG